MNFSVFDLHCDTALELIDNTCKRCDRLTERKGHIDLKRAGALPGYCQFFALFTTPDMHPQGVYTAQQIFDAMLANLLDELLANSDKIRQARSPDEAQAIVDSGRIAAVLSLEGPAGISFDVGRLDELAELGFVMTTLTWNERNPLAGSHKTGGGLTVLGAEYVRKAQKLKMAIDVSHLSEEAFWDIMDITQAPVSASHSNSRAVQDVSRNLTDRQFKAICESGGVAGINLCAPFLGEEPVTMDTICDHVIHWMEIGGGKHIALGGDLDGCSELPRDFTGIDCWPAVADALICRGVSKEEVEDIFWNNAMRMWRKCCM